MRIEIIKSKRLSRRNFRDLLAEMGGVPVIIKPTSSRDGCEPIRARYIK